LLTQPFDAGRARIGSLHSLRLCVRLALALLAASGVSACSEALPGTDRSTDRSEQADERDGDDDALHHDPGDEADEDDGSDLDAGEPGASRPGRDGGPRADAGAVDGAVDPDVVAPIGPPAPGTGDPTFPVLGTDAIDVTHYDLRLAWQPGPARLVGEAALALTTREPLRALSLDFGPQLAVTRATVAIAGEPASAVRVEHAAAKLVLPLGEAVPVGTELVATIAYEGKPRPITSSAPIPIGWLVEEGGVVATLSEPDAAHEWFPANDHPTDKATFTTALTVPRGQVAAGNGVQEGAPVANADGTVTYRYRMDAPMAPYLALVAIDDFSVQEQGVASGVPLRNFLPAGQARAYVSSIGRQPEMLALLVEKLGPYPFDEYGAVVVPGPNVALETQGRSVFQGQSALSAATVMHELAHQWLGNSVSVTRWHEDIWWVEGFARFAEWLWAERSGGARTYASRATTEYAQLRERRLPLTMPAADELFDPSVYGGGALVFYQLRRALGDEVFFAALRTFCARHRHGNATTDDLFAAFAEAAGRDVRPLVAGWFEAGPPPPL